MSGSDEYEQALAQAKAHHASSKTYSGKFLRPHKPFLSELVSRHRIRSAIDYGCGKGAQYEWVDPSDGKTIEQALGFEIRKFDPAWPPFAQEPAESERYDLTICTHVLGSIPLRDLWWVIRRLYQLGRVVYIAEKIGPVGKTALSAPELRPVGLDTEGWIRTLTPLIPAGQHTYLSTTTRSDRGTVTERRRFGPGFKEWPVIWSSEAP